MNNILNTLFLMKSICGNEYSSIIPDIFDQEIEDCIFYMNIVLLTEENDSKYEERLKRFFAHYDKLSNEKKIVVGNYLNNIKERNSKKKVRKKGNE